jgi:toxin ParE1/3/4
VARTLRWTEAAAQDLAAAADFIARDSRFYAVALVREARAAAKTLKTLAERGRVVPEAGSSDVRELFVKSYRLIYKIEPSAVTILAFVHSARNLGGVVHSLV